MFDNINTLPPLGAAYQRITSPPLGVASKLAVPVPQVVPLVVGGVLVMFTVAVIALLVVEIQELFVSLAWA